MEQTIEFKNIFGNPVSISGHVDFIDIQLFDYRYWIVY